MVGNNPGQYSGSNLKDMKIARAALLSACITAYCCLTSCAPSKLGRIRVPADILSLAEESEMPLIDTGQLHSDTLTVRDEEGKDILIMRAVKDENGEMVANDVINAAIVTAKFRNIAERNGQIIVHFDVRVPENMLDGDWQLRLHPRMTILGAEMPLDSIFITGSAYRKAQLKGYQRYRRFLNSIISDSTLLIDAHQLEAFLKRNLPELYSFREDSSIVSEERFKSAFGIGENEALEHFKHGYRIRRNNKKIASREKAFRKMVKSPIIKDGLRLDTILVSGGDFIYNYVQTVSTVPGLRKILVDLSGGIYRREKKIYDVPRSDALTFYVSSLSSLVDGKPRFLKQVLERKLEANSSCNIDFRAGSSRIDRSLGQNECEIARIEGILRSLLEDEIFDLDSIIVCASCSPEGKYSLNEKLSTQRSASVGAMLSAFISRYADSVRNSLGYVVNEADVPMFREDIPVIRRNVAENWSMLDRLIQADSLMDGDERQAYFKYASLGNADRRERSMSSMASYSYIRNRLYPKLRTVKFDFYLHRRGMIKDTVWTTVPDTLYMMGVEAIRKHDYKAALSILRPYSDYNCAIACSCLGYDASALEILERLDRNARVNYMLAVIYTRKGRVRDAAECYIKACRADPSLVHRGNLDPEISSLISTYKINENF